MRRLTWVGCVLGLAVGASVASSAAPPPRAVQRYIALLDSPDPRRRALVTEELAGIDPAVVRPAAIAALPTATPEAAARLMTVLLRTGPWAKLALPVGADPDVARADARVRQAFDTYASLSADERCDLIDQVAPDPAVFGPSVVGPAVTDALVAVLTADPSPAVRWKAVNRLRVSLGDPKLAARIVGLADAPADPATYPVPADNAPLLAAAGWALQVTDAPRAEALIGRALAIEDAAPSAFRGQADFADQWAAERAADRGDFAAAVVRYRAVAARTAYSAVRVPPSVGELLADHAAHGPFAGWADDWRQYRPYLLRPEVLYCLGRMVGRDGGLVSGPLIEVGIDAAAMAAGGLSANAHAQAGLFLHRQGWSGAAERELRAALALSGGGSADLYMALNWVAKDRDDDVAAADYLEQALKRMDGTAEWNHSDRFGNAVPWTQADALAEVHWHHLRAAVTAGDRTEALNRADLLLALDAERGVLAHDPGMAADLVPVLADAGQAARADACFDAAYAVLKKQVADGPADPMPKNNLAWLCARSGRHLDEADAASAEAVRLQPVDAACLDTRAEVLSRLHRPAEAAALEAQALSLKPENAYMRRQAARFRAAAATR